jgi:predicted AlkP superfamily phosphohydrolase/phosphomutase
VLAVITLDAASLPVLERLLDEGRLPRLQELRERGDWTQLTTPAAHFSAGVYQSLFSGTRLATNGLYFPFQWSPAEQRLRYMLDFPAPIGVWDRLSRAGRRALVVDAWECRPAEEGTVVSGWQFTNRFMLRSWSVPQGVGQGLARRFGRPPLVEEVYGRPSARGLVRLRQELLTAPGRLADAVTDLVAREPFDLLWVGLPAIHVAGHQLYDPASQLWDSESQRQAVAPEERRALTTGLDAVYEAADAALGRIVAALPAEADLILLSAVGMDVNTSRSDLLPGMLRSVLRGRAARERQEGTWIWRLRAGLSTDLRTRVARALPDSRVHDLTARLELRGIDWTQTRAFSLPTDQHGYVRLNVRGRERDGIVDPDDVDALMDEIADGLLTFRDPDGGPAVEAVDRVDDVLGDGPGLPHMPDMVVRWSNRPATRLAGVGSPKFGYVARRGGGSGRSGNHTADAWALVVPGASARRATSRPPDIVDIAATACSLLDVSREGLPGEPLLERAGVHAAARGT